MGTLTKNTGSSTEFLPAPEGDFQAVVVDCVDLGWIEKTFQGQSQGLKPHIQFVYQLGGVDTDNNDVAREDGKPYLVFGRRHTLSMNERAGCYKEICSIVGKKYLDEALNGEFDTEELIGKNVNLIIVHNESANGQVYANIESCKPWNPRFGELIELRDYDRRHERENYLAPDFSAFGPGPQGAVTPKTASPAAMASPATQNKRSTGPKEVDPRASNQGTTSKDIAKEMAKGNIPEPKHTPQIAEGSDGDDDDDPFALE